MCPTAKCAILTLAMARSLLQRIWFPLKDKRKLKEVFDEYEINIVVNVSATCSPADGLWLTRYYTSCRSLLATAERTH